MTDQAKVARRTIVQRKTRAIFKAALTRGGYFARDPEIRKMRELFDSMDTDGSGKMSKKEVRSLVRSMVSLLVSLALALCS